MSENATPSTERWWITTAAFPEGQKILGPFESQELALKVRSYVERTEGHNRYWVDEEGS